MRAIDADALFEVIKKSMAENPHKEETQRAMHIHEHKYFLTLLASFPTIQHEERTETHACDLISRQAAIDIFDDYNVSVENGELEAYSRDRKRLCELQSVQPVATDTNIGNNSKIPNGSDYISRRAAIDACIRVREHRAYDEIEEIKALPPSQPELKEGHWIPHETPDGGEQYECSRCGVLWEFNYGTPEDNEVYFCPKCGKRMIISTK